MTTPALQTVDQVRAAAHLLSDNADAYNLRLKAEAANMSSGDVYARLQEEGRLRGISNQLYFEASQRTLVAAVDDQDDLMATLEASKAKLAEFARFEHVVELVTDLLMLGGAIVSGKPSPILAALNEVRKDVKAGGKATA